MAKKNKRPLLRAVACNTRWLLGLRSDIRELINQNSPPSSEQSIISKTLHHPVLDQLHRFLLSDLRGGKR